MRFKCLTLSFLKMLNSIVIRNAFIQICYLFIHNPVSKKWIVHVNLISNLFNSMNNLQVMASINIQVNFQNISKSWLSLYHSFKDLECYILLSEQ